MYTLVRILMTWLFCLLSVLLHELGHALGYRIAAGKGEWKVIAGSGPRLVSVGRLRFRWIPVGGYFLPEEDPQTKRGKLLMLAGGPLASLLLTLLFGALRFLVAGCLSQESGLCEILFPAAHFLLFFNFFQCLFTILPLRYRVVCRGLESDGLQILRVLRP